jgi:hypothetical protein
LPEFAADDLCSLDHRLELRKSDPARRRIEAAIGIDPEFFRRHIFERRANPLGKILRRFDIMSSRSVSLLASGCEAELLLGAAQVSHIEILLRGWIRGLFEKPLAHEVDQPLESFSIDGTVAADNSL